MKIDLAVVGQGAVTPAGIGLAALLENNPRATLVSEVEEETSWPVLRVDFKDPAFAKWQREPRLRRASPLSFFLVEAGEQALRNLDAGARKKTGLIVALCSGPLIYSRRLFEAILRQGQKAASPALFPETVLNSPVSHVASILGLAGDAYALAGDDVAWISALKTAAVWLKKGDLERVLVLGGEEFDPISLNAYRSAGWLKKKSRTGFIPSEGAAGILVQSSRAQTPSPLIKVAHEGFHYRSRHDVPEAVESCFGSIDPQLPLFKTADHNRFRETEAALATGRPLVSGRNFSYLGEAFTTSAAWNTLRALTCLQPSQPHLLMPAWGASHQLGALELETSPTVDY